MRKLTRCSLLRLKEISYTVPAYSICQLRQAHEWLPLALSVASSKLTGRGWACGLYFISWVPSRRWEWQTDRQTARIRSGVCTLRLPREQYWVTIQTCPGSMHAPMNLLMLSWLSCFIAYSSFFTDSVTYTHTHTHTHTQSKQQPHTGLIMHQSQPITAYYSWPYGMSSNCTVTYLFTVPD